MLTESQAARLQPVTKDNLSTPEDVGTFLDAWKALQAEGISWTEVSDVVTNGTHFFFVEGGGFNLYQELRTRSGNDRFSLFDLAAMDLPSRGVGNSSLYNVGAVPVSPTLPSGFQDALAAMSAKVAPAPPPPAPVAPPAALSEFQNVLAEAAAKVAVPAPAPTPVIEDLEEAPTGYLLSITLIGSDEQFSYNLTDNIPRTIGRSSKSSDIPVGIHGHVSRVHARLQIGQDGSLLIWDNNSTNGTFVNGRRISSTVPTVVNPGDEVTLGDYTITVVNN